MFTNFKKTIQLNNHIDKPIWDKFEQVIIVKNFKKGEIITRENQIEQYIYFIEKGGVRIYYLKNGLEINVDFRFEGRMISSYTSFLKQKPSRQYLEALEDTTLYALSFESLQYFYNNTSMGERIGRMNAEQLFTEVEEHQAALLLDSPDEKFNNLRSHKKEWILRVPQKFLASYLNMTPETYSRLKKRNKPTGKIN